jgi:hypothetical protein
MMGRKTFEAEAVKRGWDIRRSHIGYYNQTNVHYAWIGYCMALGLDPQQED